MADNQETLICPACGKEMVKIYMPNQGINLDICLNGCGGIYFDNREFDKVNEQNEDISALEKVFSGKTFKKADETEKRYCPVCGAVMVKNFSSAKKEVEIDECYSCGGKFLDYGELEKIRAQYKNDEERASDVIKELYKTAGSELINFENDYEKRMEKPSILSKIIRIKY